MQEKQPQPPDEQRRLDERAGQPSLRRAHNDVPRWATARGAAPSSGLFAGTAPGQRVQRKEEEGAATEPQAAATAPDLLVEDGAAGELAPGQMRKSEFLELLRAQVCATAEEALAGTIWWAPSCPYIERWFDYYGGRDAAYIERALRRYAPETIGAADARDYIAPICARVRDGITTWTTTGEVAGVPADIPVSASSPGPPAAGENGPVMAKGQGDGSASVNPAAVRAQLGAGAPLDSGVRGRMENALGTDLGAVRVHTDARADRLAGEQRARAFAVGAHVAFGAGEYQPGTPAGDALLAHELAHVAQQRDGGAGGASYGALEEDADRSAVGAVMALWSGSRALAGRTLPALRSGLRLQRCTKTSSGPIGPTRLAEARENFVSNHSNLTAAERNKIDSALNAVAHDNTDLWIAFYDYYTSQRITKMNADAAAKATKGGLYAETSPSSGTVVRPDMLDASFPDAKLGTLLIHEFTHTRHLTNYMGMGDYQEGDSYGIEYFFALRAGETTRQAEILNVMSKPTSLTIGVGVPALQRSFRVSYATMVALYEIIDSGSSTRGAPALSGLTPDQARALVAELVAKRQSSHSVALQGITTWVAANLASFTIPI